MALGYRNSTPNNILLGESKLTTIEDRVKMLGCNFFIKSLSNKNSLTTLALKSFFPNLVRSKLKKKSTLSECIRSAISMEHLIISEEKFIHI